MTIISIYLSIVLYYFYQNDFHYLYNCVSRVCVLQEGEEVPGAGLHPPAPHLQHAAIRPAENQTQTVRPHTHIAYTVKSLKIIRGHKILWFDDDDGHVRGHLN